jgi:hypothetical protein
MQDDNNLGGYNVYGDNSANGLPTRQLSSDTYASDTFADIIRGEYADYEQRFQPYETKLLSLAENTQLLDEQLGRITTNINNSYSNPQRSMGNVMKGRYGVQNNAQERQSMNRDTNINKALSTAHAKNNTRVMNGDRQMGLVTGTSGNTRQSAVNATNQGG